VQETLVGPSSFVMADLTREACTVYLVVPPGQVEEHAPFSRLCVSLAASAVAHVSKTAPPVLFVLDEFAALGRLSALERIAARPPGSGVTLWPIVESLQESRSLRPPPRGSRSHPCG
jgi:type IV secretion system protein VirD4